MREEAQGVDESGEAEDIGRPKDDGRPEGISRPRTNRLPEMLWEEIDRPGCYLLPDAGLIARLPRSALGPGTLPLVTLVSEKPVRAVRISDDPTERIEVLRAVMREHP
ncbi:MAG: hypothetical protein KBD56_08345 [Candidatus Eisenbacteria bacterium]|nr:hypothetical protein [Candidatus Eisenbacteria bacterium]